VISVKVIRKDFVARRTAGTIEFRGIMVGSADGVPVNDEINRIPYSFQCNPRGLVSDESAQCIADELSRGFDKGKIGEIEWRTDNANQQRLRY
jgi:hypothetical protein